MKDPIEVGSETIIFIVSFIKIVSVIQMLLRGIHIQTRRHTDSKLIT
jgi:hypothetical protein